MTSPYLSTLPGVRVPDLDGLPTGSPGARFLLHARSHTGPRRHDPGRGMATSGRVGDAIASAGRIRGYVNAAPGADFYLAGIDATAEGGLEGFCECGAPQRWWCRHLVALSYVGGAMLCTDPGLAAWRGDVPPVVASRLDTPLLVVTPQRPTVPPAPDLDQITPALLPDDTSELVAALHRVVRARPASEHLADCCRIVPPPSRVRARLALEA